MVTILGFSALAICVVMMCGAGLSMAINRYAIVDVIWSAAFTAATATAVITSLVLKVGEPMRSLIVGLMVLMWALRLGSHLGRRTFTSTSDDPRYVEFMGGSVREVPFTAVLTKIYALQGLLVLVVGYAVLASTAVPVQWSAGVFIGVGVWAAGMLIEAIADHQLEHFRSLPPLERPAVLSSGLWAWSRHPNYFGEAVIWWGIWLASGAASGTVVALWTVPAPIALTLIVTAVSGVRIAERRMQGRPGWDEYASRTSVFVPWPPR
jgi:steroid 5-alpha reductase family enzyme